MSKGLKKADGFLDENIMSLQDITLKYICSNLKIISSEENDVNMKRVMHKHILLPSVLCDEILAKYQEFNCTTGDIIINLFRDTKTTNLKNVRLRNSFITSYGLKILFRHRLSTLSLWYCDNFTEKDISDIMKFTSRNLHTLELGTSANPRTPFAYMRQSFLPSQIRCKKLRRLILNGISLNIHFNLKNLWHLNYLDLSRSEIGNSTFSNVHSLSALTTLILSNVWPMEGHLYGIMELKALRVLDLSISNSGDGYGTYESPDYTLKTLIEKLIALTHLDISGTNLAGNGVATRNSYHKSTDIPGLASRIQNPLQFLGLYHTAHWACKRHHIPALEIAGDANEEQILTAARYYADRPVFLTRVLNDLYHLFRFENCNNVDIALDIVLKAMDRHLKFKHMQISGSATLFYIIKGRDRKKFGSLLRNHIIRTLLNGMQMHILDETMLRNGYLTLTQFQMPNDVLFEYERLIAVLLHGVSETEQEGFVQRIAIYLLNTLACQVDGHQKLYLGEFGVVNTMLTLINDRLTRSVFDDVMEVAWSTMWNVTDETAINCKRFLDGHGMEYFLRCLEIFRDRDELLRNMMGLLGNVAEVKWLRPRLMTQKFIKVFAELLSSESDGIEVSYNAAGVLAHIASDGPEAWVIKEPSRESVLSSMIVAIRSWDIESERNINYRSFEPILGLVRCYETPECQHWAVWALANLTNVYPEKYCHLVEQEKGIKILKELIEHPNPYDEIKEIAKLVINRCDRWPNEMIGA